MRGDVGGFPIMPSRGDPEVPEKDRDGLGNIQDGEGANRRDANNGVASVDVVASQSSAFVAEHESRRVEAAFLQPVQCGLRGQGGVRVPASSGCGSEHCGLIGRGVAQGFENPHLEVLLGTACPI